MNFSPGSSPSARKAASIASSRLEALDEAHAERDEAIIRANTVQFGEQFSVQQAMEQFKRIRRRYGVVKLSLRYAWPYLAYNLSPFARRLRGVR